nr:T-cell receptor delta chain variable region {NuVD5.4, VDJ junction} [nude mice, bone marrow, Peptide Partial, 15 aa] [Mus musculus]
ASGWHIGFRRDTTDK